MIDIKTPVQQVSRAFILRYALSFTLFDYLLIVLYLISTKELNDIDGIGNYLLFLALFLMSIISTLIIKNTLLTGSNFKKKAYAFLGSSMGSYVLVVVLGFASIYYALLSISDSFSGSEAEGAGWFIFLSFFGVIVGAGIYLVLTICNIVLLYLLERSRIRGGKIFTIILTILAIMLIPVIISPKWSQSRLNYRDSYPLNETAEITKEEIRSGYMTETVRYFDQSSGEVVEGKYLGNDPQYKGAIDFIQKTLPAGSKVVSDSDEDLSRSIRANRMIAYGNWMDSSTPESALVQQIYAAAYAPELDFLLGGLAADYLWLTWNTRFYLQFDDETRSNVRGLSSDDRPAIYRGKIIYRMWDGSEVPPTYELVYQDQSSKIYKIK